MSAAANRQAPAHRGWTHHVPDSFFDRPDLEPNLERLAFRLERLARDKPWCITSNDELRELLGCSRNTLAAALIRGESRGWFRRVLVPGRHGRATGRLGIVLFVRPSEPATSPLPRPSTRSPTRSGRHPPRFGTLPDPPNPPLPRPDSPRIGRRRPPGFGHHGPQKLGTTGPQKLGSAPLIRKKKLLGERQKRRRRRVPTFKRRPPSMHFPGRRRRFSIWDRNRKRPGPPVSSCRGNHRSPGPRGRRIHAFVRLPPAPMATPPVPAGPARDRRAAGRAVRGGGRSDSRSEPCMVVEPGERLRRVRCGPGAAGVGVGEDPTGREAGPVCAGWR